MPQGKRKFRAAESHLQFAQLLGVLKSEPQIKRPPLPCGRAGCSVMADLLAPPDQVVRAAMAGRPWLLLFLQFQRKPGALPVPDFNSRVNIKPLLVRSPGDKIAAVGAVEPLAGAESAVKFTAAMADSRHDENRIRGRAKAEKFQALLPLYARFSRSLIFPSSSRAHLS